jgi:Pyridoxamine 5'-phosphate oxidase
MEAFAMTQGALSAAFQRDLDALVKASLIYVATVRKDGNQSKAAPVWFTVAPDHTILIQSAPGAWKARRIRRGSPVIVRIGRRNGPGFVGRAQITSDVEDLGRIIDQYPRRYLLARLGFHRPTRAMFDQGRIVAIRIAALRDLPEGFVSRRGAPAPSVDAACAGAASPPH